MFITRSPIVTIAAFILYALVTPADSSSPTITVNLNGGKPIATFVPDRALGAALDGYENGDIAKIYTKPNVAAMKSAGFRSISYRLRTELGIEAWHWNPRGSWSNPGAKNGYWTSSSTPGTPIEQCNGYSLPRRGDSSDQANDNGYSRIDDGDPSTFWKSNPYLEAPFAPEAHPQWIVVILAKPTPVDTLDIDWAAPYAVRFRVQYWQAHAPDNADWLVTTSDPRGEWTTFPGGSIDNGCGGDQRLQLTTTPITVKYVRIMLLSGSHTSLGPSRDIRDSLGYAVREISLGSTNTSRLFHDVIRHTHSGDTQTTIYVWSTDPWHGAADIDKDTEQPGFDRLFRSGITCGNPIMVPVGVVYDTPDNAVAEIRYLRKRGYAFDRVEMGEEPDGQYITPEDYGALYVEWANALHKYDPRLKLGGPCYQTMAQNEIAWPDASGDTSWTHRFVQYLREHAHLADLAFFSSEFYFYDDVCALPSPKLEHMPALVDKAFKNWTSSGVPTEIPWVASEFGYSPFAGQPEVDVPGGLLDADFIGHFLTRGGSSLFFYGLEPNSLIEESDICQTWGNLALWQSDDDRHIIAPFAAYYIVRLVTQEWSEPGNRPMALFSAKSNIENANGEAVVSAYAARRPDGLYSIMIVNKDPASPYHIRLKFAGGTANRLAWRVEIYQYSGHQYQWHPNTDHGYASPNLPPEHWTIQANKDTTYLLPPMSITILRGQLTGNYHIRL